MQVIVNEQYRYDPLRRPTNAAIASGGTSTTVWYEYDNVGNRVRQSLNGITNYSYNIANNELISSTSGNGTSYSYYSDGTLKTQNITSSNTNWTYAWDVPGRLVNAANGAGVQGHYAYDGQGRRIEAKEGTSTTFYSYLITETLFEVQSGGTETDYVYVSGMRIARLTGYGGTSPTANYFHEDALGSTRLVTALGITIVFSDNYQPYGQDNLASGSETYKFTGKPVSAATGLY